MLPALVITLREGMEIALLLGVLLTYLQRTGRTFLNRQVYWGLGLAILVSLVIGILLQVFGLDPENELLEGTLFAVGGVFVASMVVWMWRNAPNLTRQVETRVESITSGGKTSSRAGIGLLVFTFFMVAREGIETVFFLAAATLGQGSILDVTGGILGIALAVLFAVLFIRNSLKINLKRFFTVTTVVLLILALRLLAGSVHEFAEVGVLPMSSGVMKALSYLVRDRAASVLLMGLVLVPILVVLWDFRKARTASVPQSESGAERRKRLATRRWEQVWQFGLLGATGVIILTMASQVLADSPFLDPAPQPVTASPSGEIRLSVADWEPGKLNRFSYAVAGSEVRFIAAKLDDGSITTAMDACQICGIKGYMQEKETRVVVCKVCNAPIPMNTMGLGGGCNPLTLSSRVDGSSLVVPVKGLESKAALFKGE